MDGVETLRMRLNNGRAYARASDRAGRDILSGERLARQLDEG